MGREGERDTTVRGCYYWQAVCMLEKKRRKGGEGENCDSAKSHPGKMECQDMTAPVTPFLALEAGESEIQGLPQLQEMLGIDALSRELRPQPCNHCQLQSSWTEPLICDRWQGRDKSGLGCNREFGDP